MSILVEILSDAQDLGFLGRGSVEVAVDHAHGFAVGVEAPTRFVDLGSGGGLPGLVLAGVWPDAEGILIEANLRRCGFLERAVEALGYGDRVTVLQERAEAAGRRAELRGRCGVVVARSFGSPAVTAECGAPLLWVGGWLIVSEPPEASASTLSRWPPEPLAQLGLGVERGWKTDFHYQALRQVQLCPERYPRRVGVPAKRPLY